MTDELDPDNPPAQGAYVCVGCDERFPRDDYPEPHQALDDAKQHTARCPEATAGGYVFDAGLPAEAYGLDRADFDDGDGGELA